MKEKGNKEKEKGKRKRKKEKKRIIKKNLRDGFIKNSVPKV